MQHWPFPKSAFAVLSAATALSSTSEWCVATENASDALALYPCRACFLALQPRSLLGWLARRCASKAWASLPVHCPTSVRLRVCLCLQANLFSNGVEFLFDEFLNSSDSEGLSDGGKDSGSDDAQAGASDQGDSSECAGGPHLTLHRMPQPVTASAQEAPLPPETALIALPVCYGTMPGVKALRPARSSANVNDRRHPARRLTSTPPPAGAPCEHH